MWDSQKQGFTWSMILYQHRFLVMCPTQILLSAVHLRLGRVLVYCIQELQRVWTLLLVKVISITISVKCTSLWPQGSTFIKSQDPDNFLKIVYLVTSELCKNVAKYLHNECNFVIFMHKITLLLIKICKIWIKVCILLPRSFLLCLES